MDLCLTADRRPGSRVEKRWWGHESLYLQGIWTAVQETERTEGGEDTDGTEM